MYALASTPFEREAFQQRWQEFGWSYVPKTADEFGFQVEIDAGIGLMVAPRGDRVECASLPFCYWEEYDPEWHDSPQSHKAQRRQYDRAYEQAFRQVQAILDSPFRTGEDPPVLTEGVRYRWAAWRGETALLILQQCLYDAQFGIEVNLWLEPCKVADFTPSPPLIDWLMGRHSPPDTQTSASAA
jgi:hypothetical protein